MSYQVFLDELKSFITHRQLNVRETLFRRNEVAFALFAVEVGRIRLVRYLANGTEACLHVARVGESFAEAALFSEVYHCDAIAELPSRVAIYPKEAILQLLQGHPDAALGFTALLAKHVQSLRTQLELRNVHSARDRTLQYLSLLTEPGRSVITFDRPLKDVATDIGLTHEAFYRALAQLKREGYIQQRRRQITLIHPEL
jgi:CRP/FNR family transcriptional regulator, dissimilatory nitrate respiration regulator